MRSRPLGILLAFPTLALALTLLVSVGRDPGPEPAPIARSRPPIGRLHAPPWPELERLVAEGSVPGAVPGVAEDPEGPPQAERAAREAWLRGVNPAARRVNDAVALANERAVLARERARAGAGGRGTRLDRQAGSSGLTQGGVTTTEAAILVIPVEFAASETLAYQVQSADATACVTVTGTFSGPLHGRIPYPGGSPETTRDNQTVWYPSTEPEDYARLIFGTTGYTEPLRAGDPQVNGGRGVDLRGLTVQSYFADQSDDTVSLTGTVAAWVPVPHSEAYYGLDQCVPNVSSVAIPDQQLGSLAELAIAGAEGLKARGDRFGEHAFWKQFDRDGDGFLDALWIIHAGRGQEYGGGPEGAASIWSRASDLRDYEAHAEGHLIHDNGNADPSDDLRLGPLTFVPEDSDIGVLVEEFGHSYFGLPDLYTMRSSNSVGWWAPMSDGIWGGELGGSRPVNMPLWFRMVADCGGGPCGWADPVKVLPHDTAPEIVVLGQAGSPAGGTVAEGPHAGQTIYEGLRVTLPDQEQVTPNLAGTGGGAHSGAETGISLSLERSIDLGAVGAGEVPLLSFDAEWRIPRYWGYAYVEASTDGQSYRSLPDTTGFFTDENPYGLNEGFGLTGSGAGRPVFDLSAYRGQILQLRFRYFTYQGAVGTGLWLDALRIERGTGGPALVEEDFEGGLGAWDAGGWDAVPRTERFPHHYLVEWRNAEGFDASLLGATSTSFRDADEWRVDRVPANLPGALVMYRNLKYPFSGAFLGNLQDPPSYGSKYGLLVVDPQFRPHARPSGAPYPGRLESLDAALARQDQPDYRLEQRDPATGALQATDAMTGRPGLARFDDAHGYYPGFTLNAEGAAVVVDEDASVVLPAREDRRYSTRLTRADGSPALGNYGRPFGQGHAYGSGDPADDAAQIGLRIELVDRAPDGSWGALRIVNAGVDYGLRAEAGPEPRALPGAPLGFLVEARNFGQIEQSLRFSVILPAGFGHLDGPLDGLGSVRPGETLQVPITIRAPSGAGLALGPDDQAMVEARFDDGTDTWLRRLPIHGPWRGFLPAALHGADLASPIIGPGAGDPRR